MADDEGFRRYLQAGMAWFSVTQQKAEGILRDLTDSGETAVGQAQKMFERIVERGRQGSDELRDLVRSEIQEQVGALGLATKDDLARLEAKLDAVQTAPPTAEPPTPPKATRPKPAPVTKSGPVTKAATSRKAPSAKGTVPKATTQTGPGPKAGDPKAGDPKAGDPKAGDPKATGTPSGGPASGGSTTAAAARKAARRPRDAAPSPRSSPEEA